MGRKESNQTNKQKQIQNMEFNSDHKKESIIWASAWDFQQYGMFDQQSLRSACAYAQSDQSLC